MLEPIKINNHQVFIDNIYVIGDLAFLFILLGNECSSPKWCFKYKLHPKVWLDHGYKIVEDWTQNSLRLVLEYDSTGSVRLSGDENIF